MVQVAQGNNALGVAAVQNIRILLARTVLRPATHQAMGLKEWIAAESDLRWKQCGLGKRGK
jgi:hypothetical protein